DAVAFSNRPGAARVDAAAEWKRDAGAVDGHRASTRTGQHHQFNGGDDLRQYRDDVLCGGGVFWSGRDQTDPTRDSGRITGGSDRNHCVGNYLPRGALKYFCRQKTAAATPAITA